MLPQKKIRQLALQTRKRINFILVNFYSMNFKLSAMEKKCVLNCFFVKANSYRKSTAVFDLWYEKFRKEMQSEPFHELYL